ncbi:hypothetical protein CPAR01_02462, partial [Colletotrichum paranaense]
ICSAVRCFGTLWASCPPPPETHLSNLAFCLNPARLLARHLKLVEPAQGPSRPIIRRLPRSRTSCRILH